MIFNESDFQYDSSNTDEGATVCHEQVTIPEDEPIELPNELQPREQVVPEHQRRYPRR